MKKDILILILICLTIALPIFFYYTPSEIILPIFLLSILLSAFFWIQAKNFYVDRGFNIIFILYLLVNLVSTIFFSDYQFGSFLELLKSINIFFLVNLATNLFIQKKNFSYFLFFLILVTAFFALSGIVEFTGREMTKEIALFKPFDWPTLSASFFLLIFPPAFSLFTQKNENKMKKVFLFSSVFLIITAWILTRTYLASLFFIIFLILYLRFSNLSLLKENKNLIREVFYLTLLVFFTLPNLLFSFGQNTISVPAANFQQNIIFQDRKDISRFAKESVKQNLWKGVGIGNFGGKYRQNKINAWIYSKYASNELLQTLVEKGIPGLITTLLLFSYIIFISLKGILTFAKNKDITDFAVSLSVLIFLIINLVDFPLRIFPIELCFFLFFSSLLAKKKLVVLPKKIFYLFFIPFFLVSTILFKDNLDLRSGKKAFAKGEFERSEKIFKTYIVGPKIIINPESLYWLAAIQVEKDQGELAIEYLNKAKMLDCFNEESDYEIAKIKYQKNELDEAAKILFSSIEKNYFLPPKYYWTYVKILLEKNRNNEALDLLKQAEKIYLSNPNLLNEKKSVLEETDFLSDLKEIYFLLFKLTNDKNYLVSLFSI